jgi:hypothetical protein
MESNVKKIENPKKLSEALRVCNELSYLINISKYHIFN